MKINEIRSLEVTDLKQKLHDLKKELFNLKFQKTFAVLETPSAIRSIKKDIAKCMTILNEKRMTEKVHGA